MLAATFDTRRKPDLAVTLARRRKQRRQVRFALKTTPAQNRRIISTSSGLASSSKVTVFGSSAMPQIGQLPGSERTISGCMGQTYSALSDGARPLPVRAPCHTSGKHRASIPALRNPSDRHKFHRHLSSVSEKLAVRVRYVAAAANDRVDAGDARESQTSGTSRGSV
jgi:hypothetical protein